MGEQDRGNRWREQAKLAVRTRLHRLGLSIGRDPYANRLQRVLADRGIASVLDIGANVGQYARALRSSGFGGDIVSVEPLRGAYGQLCRRADADAAWTTVNAAVGAEVGSAAIRVSANSFSSSLLPMTRRHLDADPASRVVGVEEVAVTTVVELVREHGLSAGTTLLKVDTQGFERPVLAGAGDLVDELAAIQLELSFVELYEGQDLFDETVEQLRGHGLVLWSLETGISDRTGRLLQCDGLFVREPTP